MNAAPGSSVTDVKLTYLRYKPGVNCVAGYEFQADDETRFAYTKIFSEDQKDKREKFNAQADAQCTDGFIFSFFPNDSKLRSLKRIDSSAGEKQFLQRVFSDRKDLWAGKIHAIRYKPERRFVSRLVLDGLDVSVVKMHTGNSYSRLRNSNKSFKSRENLKLARRIGHSDRHHVLAFEWLPGHLLSDTLRAGDLSPNSMLPVGKALAHIHEQRPDHLPKNSPEMQADHIQSVAQQVSFLYPELASRLTQTATQLNALLLEGSWNYVATHGDFYAKQILIDGDLVGVLDLDESALDDPMSDLGNFFAHLERDRLRFDLSIHQVDGYQQALLEGYSNAGRPINSQRVALFFAANLFKLLPHPFRFREANWPEQTTLLLEKVQYALLKAQASKTYLPSNGHTYVITPADLPSTTQDEALPFLEVALNQEDALPVISKALKTNYPDSTIASITRTNLRRHKPGRRCLIEYTLQLRHISDTFTSVTVLGKSHYKKLNTSTFDLTQKLWNGSFNISSNDGLYVPEPLGKAPAFNMWLQQKIEGYTATHYLEGLIGILMARGIAHALHKLNTQGPASDRVHTIQDELSILEQRLSLTSASNPQWTQRIQKVLAACQKLAAEVPELTPQPIHRDYYPDNLLIASNGIYILDLDLYCMGDPALDAGNFIGHVMEYSLRKHGGPNNLEPITRAFEDAYIALAGEHVRPLINIYTTLTLARHIQISTLFEDRKAFTADILALCERRISKKIQQTS